MQRHFSIFLAGAIAITGASTGFAPVEAMPRILPAIVADAAPHLSTEQAGEDTGVTLVRNRGSRHRQWRSHRNHWRPSRHRQHYRYPRYGYRHHHGYRHHYGYRHHSGGAAAAGIIGFAAGAIIGGALSQGGYGSSYHGACSRKYRSYSPASGTYLGYDGYRHRCVLP